MLYAQVIVKKKTRVEELTYRIPAVIIPVITVGSLVSVPLRRKVVPAVVVRFVRTVPIALKPRLREISAIAKNQPHFSAEQISVIHRLSDYYGAPLAQVAFHALQEANFWPTNSASLPATKPQFIQGTWSARRGHYQSLLEKPAPNHFLFVFAQNSLAEDLFNSLPTVLQDRTVLNDGSAASRLKRKKLIAESKLRAVIGTASSAFWPLQAGDMIVVDQPAHVGAVSAQRPFMSASQIALTRTEVEKLQLVLGDVLIKIENLPRLQKRQWQLQALPLTRRPVFVSDRRGSGELLLPSLVKDMAEHLKKREKVLALVLARGWASALICRDCGQTFTCPQCDRTMVVRETTLDCPFCATNIARPLTCPSCRRPNLQPIGEGVAQVTRKLEKFFPQVRISSYSSDQPEFDQNADITVATEKILGVPAARFGLVVVVSADRLLGGTQLNGSAQLLGDLLELQERSQALLIQTYMPDSPGWSAIGSHNLRQFYQQELTGRRTLKLPPFSTIFRLIGQGRTVTELESQLENITNDLLHFLPAAEVSFLEITGRSGRNFRVQVQVLTPAMLSTKIKRQIAQVLPIAWQLNLE